VRDERGDLLEGLLDADDRLAGLEEGRLFGGEWLRSLGMIPNEYLYYFYFGADIVHAIRESPASRGAFLLEQQRAFYAADGQDGAAAVAAWRATRHDRERTYMAEARSAAGDDTEPEPGGGYESEAMAVLEAIALNTRAVLILNTANRTSLPFLDGRAVVEVPAVVSRAGPVALATGDVPAHARSLIELMKEVERTTIDAALTGSSALAVKALALHPLVPSVSVAREILDGYRRRLPELAEAFPS
jgi:6-phospho-beta-glucosidase